ncbi:hypothetical protein BDA99DRAFT_533162 [Phascolomyces articulosus]|uniref:Uncharacterized protein n=1 Tax=Phascolomyces articulosus TaxID=60185 RepID=A0AAD5K8H4_9FUNG|nr:hypothetical protein BDA99DRAFT_533162 [Phascolomyces articulosus]
MRTSTAILSALFVLVAYLSGSYAQEGLFNVTSPEPNSPYTAGQKLPLIYEIPSTTTENNLQLSISLVNPANATANVIMVSNADVSHGFSNQKDLGNNVTVYEHQANYDIPTTTTAGAYQVIFTNTLTGYNTTVPITIAEAGSPSAKPSSTGGSSGGGDKSMWDTGAASSNAPVLFTVFAAVAVALSM